MNQTFPRLWSAKIKICSGFNAIARTSFSYPSRWNTYRGTCTLDCLLSLSLNARYVELIEQNTMAIRKSKSDGQIARAAVNLGISVAGLVIIRLIVQNLPMFQDVGWIVKDKLSVAAAAVIVVDAMLLSVLIGFAIQIRAYLFARFQEVPALGSMAVSLVLLICAGLAYKDFKPLTRAWPFHQGRLRLGILRSRCGPRWRISSSCYTKTEIVWRRWRCASPCPRLPQEEPATIPKIQRPLWPPADNRYIRSVPEAKRWQPLPTPRSRRKQRLPTTRLRPSGGRGWNRWMSSAG